MASGPAPLSPRSGALALRGAGDARNRTRRFRLPQWGSARHGRRLDGVDGCSHDGQPSTKTTTGSTSCRRSSWSGARWRISEPSRRSSRRRSSTSWRRAVSKRGASALGQRPDRSTGLAHENRLERSPFELSLFVNSLASTLVLTTSRNWLDVVPEHVGSSGPPWRLSAVKGSSDFQGGDPDGSAR